MSFADFLENELLDHVWGDSAYTAPSTIYVGLSTTTPNDDGTNITEPSGAANYARVAVANNLTNWPAAVAGAKSNGVAASFNQASGSWGVVTHFFFADALTSGNILGSGALSTSKTIDSGDSASFAIGDLDITLD